MTFFCLFQLVLQDLNSKQKEALGLSLNLPTTFSSVAESYISGNLTPTHFFAQKSKKEALF